MCRCFYSSGIICLFTLTYLLYDLCMFSYLSEKNMKYLFIKDDKASDIVELSNHP